MAQITFSVRMDETIKRQFDVLSESVSGEIPNAETIAALEEGEEMLHNPTKYKRYASFRKALDEMLNDA